LTNRKKNDKINSSFEKRAKNKSEFKTKMLSIQNISTLIFDGVIMSVAITAFLIFKD